MDAFSFKLRLGTLLLVMSGPAFLPPRALGQFPSFDGPSLPGLWDINPASSDLGSAAAASPIGRTPRLRLFRIAPGFRADPLDMQDIEGEGPGMPSLAGANPESTDQASGPDWIQFGMGSDNPFVDLRLPGDPGGYGYFRLNTQVSLLDSPTTACAFDFQAVAPAGAQYGGLPTGATVVVPALSVFHALNDRLALQGFVSKNVPINDAAAAPLQRNVQYGLALQRPLLDDGPQGLRNLFFSVGALGQLAAEGASLRPTPNYDVLPGLQWHLNDNWWVSSCLLVPLGSTRPAPGQWQLSCSLRF
jgi:hypothetical protein